MDLLHLIYKEIDKNLTYFSVKEKVNIDTYKRFTELAVFFELTVDNLTSDTEKNTCLLKEHIISEVKSLSPDSILKNVNVSYHIISPYVSIRNHIKIESLEKCLDIVVDNNLFPLETPPHREMEWDYMLYKLGKCSFVKIPNNCILKQDFHLQFIDRELAYAITHALFYTTNFGFANNKPPVKDLGKLKFQLECLIAKFYEENDIDLILELGINYFHLLQFVEIDYNILIIINNCLERTSFIEFEWTKEIINKKYHSFLVLGIFSAVLKTLLISPKVSEAKKTTLKRIIDKTMFNENKYVKSIKEENLIETMPTIQAWSILKSLKIKNFDKDAYSLYTTKFGKNAYLSEGILSYLQILKQRNELEILWNREFEKLDLNPKAQFILKNDFIVKVNLDIEYLNNN
jgi:hypothetical protein